MPLAIVATISGFELDINHLKRGIYFNKCEYIHTEMSIQHEISIL